MRSEVAKAVMAAVVVILDVRARKTEGTYKPGAGSDGSATKEEEEEDDDDDDDDDEEEEEEAGAPCSCEG